jgi:hypothetical protein
MQRNSKDAPKFCSSSGPMVSTFSMTKLIELAREKRRPALLGGSAVADLK